MIGISDGRVLQANDCMREIYGCLPGERMEDCFSFVGHSSFADLIVALQGESPWTGRSHPKKSRHGIASTEVMLQIAPGGDWIWLYTLEHPRVNRQVRFSSRSELKMLRVLLDNTLEYVFFRDVQGHFILTNRVFHDAVADATRFPDVDNTIADFMSEKSAKWFGDLDDAVRRTGEPVVNVDSEITFKNGIKHWLQLTTVPVRNGEGEIIGFLSVARDISDLKRTESELRAAIEFANQASKAKDQFLAAMSHEIRTPINGIIGASELCQETDLDSEQKSYIDTVVQCGNTLLTLVNDVLDFSKIEAGQLNLEKLNFNPLNTLESVAEEFAQMIRAKDVELIVACSDNLPDHLMGDPTRLKQVLYNLVGNSIKFTDYGQIVLRAEVLELSPDAARIRFEVEDTGIGIAADRREAIFESFTQADMSTSRKYGGTGLGLAICRELVHLMGGEIGVDSTEGQGSTFFFELPFERTRVVGAESVPFNPELAGLRVLIVDDNPTNREIYSQMCAGWGYRSSSVADGVAAMKMMEDAVRANDRFRLLLLDQQMPGLIGLDLASLVKSRTDLRQTKIIILSSSLDRSESLRAAHIGVERTLSKPIKRATLLEVILETFEIGEPRSDHGPEIKPSTPKRKSLRLLLAEDNPVNQIVATKRLEKLGHRVIVAGDGNTVLERVQEARFDGIFMDIQMPGMDGYETTSKIRAYEKAKKLDPHWIVAMTAHAMKGDEERCLQAGMDDYISKPFRTETLVAVLDRMEAAYRPADLAHTGSRSETPHSFREFLETMGAEDREDRLAAAEVFLETLPEELLRLEQAVKSGEAEPIQFAAHSLKGVAGLFGDARSVALALELEQVAGDAGGALPRARLESLGDRLSASLHALAAEIETVLEAGAD